MSIYYTVMSDDTPRGTNHTRVIKIYSPTRGKVAQPCELMVVKEIRLCSLMNTNIVIVVEYSENKISQTLMVINVMDDTTTIYVLCIGMAGKYCNHRRKFRE